MKMEEKDFEPAGLIPRSIIRTVERFQQQLRPETVALGIQEFRISRYQVRVSVRYFFILLLLPVTINWGAKNLIIKPLVGYFWNTYQTSLFLNNYQAERAFQEMRDFESQLFFEMLLSSPEKVSETWGTANIETLDSTKQISLQKENKRIFSLTSPSLRVKASWMEPLGSPSLNRFNQMQTNWSHKPQGYAMQKPHSFNKVQRLNLLACRAPVAPPCAWVVDPPYEPKAQTRHLDQVGLCPLTNAPDATEGAKVHGPVGLLGALATSPKSTPEAQAQEERAYGPSVPTVWVSGPLKVQILTPQEVLDQRSTSGHRTNRNCPDPLIEPSAQHEVQDLRSVPLGCKIGKDYQNVSNLCSGLAPMAWAKGPNMVQTLQNKVWNPKKNEVLLTNFINYNFCSDFTTEEKPYIGRHLVDTGLQIKKTDLCFASLFQQKTVLLAELYNQQSITALSNMFGDFVMILAIIFLVRWNAPQFTILKSFLIESFYSFNDAIKCFYIILITDFLVGFHSPRGWEIAMEMLLRHLGLPENEEFILLFVGTFPVFLDTAFKYWIFRYLNKISPSTVATYHSMIE